MHVFLVSKTRREEWEKVFERQSKGEITPAPEEQIRELSKSCSRGGGGGRGGAGSEWETKPSSLTSKRPCHSNNHGRLSEITGDECPHLRKLDMDVGLANITRVSTFTHSLVLSHHACTWLFRPNINSETQITMQVGLF